ncbi:hypothetical protein AXG93_1647s1030 [Marchantia polymorpha subsp. ruderalis]|uniref:Biogenesis of lysosome-related organelles complex 1 subunit 5 n=1 Tax=Marchantia polymorpha subsp. ruderalis TaxID=1480154 RepID=A0A176VDA2_MARPO|nr:hypothetical protein AXG93_1647s1030 [Marchantia polymorpha subsp. ruderalis]
MSTWTVILENREDPSAGETQSGGINVVKMICEQVVPLLRYLDGKLGKYGGPFDVESYVELTDVETIRRAIVDLRHRLKASRVAFNAKSHRVVELTADMAKRHRAHAAKLAAKAKELAECVAAWSLELEHLEKLEAAMRCSRSDRQQKNN